MRFLKTVQKAGLYAHLRIGPYVCAEWNFGYPLFKFLFFSVEFIGVIFVMCYFFANCVVDFQFGSSMSQVSASEQIMSHLRS